MVPEALFDPGGVGHAGVVEAHEVDRPSFVGIGESAGREDADAGVSACLGEGLVLRLGDGPSHSRVVEFRGDAGICDLVGGRKIVEGRFCHEEDAEASGGGKHDPKISGRLGIAAQVLFPEGQVKESGVGEGDNALVEPGVFEMVAAGEDGQGQAGEDHGDEDQLGFICRGQVREFFCFDAFHCGECQCQEACGNGEGYLRIFIKEPMQVAQSVCYIVFFAAGYFGVVGVWEGVAKIGKAPADQCEEGDGVRACRYENCFDALLYTAGRGLLDKCDRDEQDTEGDTFGASQDHDGNRACEPDGGEGLTGEVIISQQEGIADDEVQPQACLHQTQDVPFQEAQGEEQQAEHQDIGGGNGFGGGIVTLSDKEQEAVDGNIGEDKTEQEQQPHVMFAGDPIKQGADQRPQQGSEAFDPFAADGPDESMAMGDVAHVDHVDICVIDAVKGFVVALPVKEECEDEREEGKQMEGDFSGKAH